MVEFRPHDIVLGIDLGTTSAKVCALEAATGKVVYECSSLTVSDVESKHTASGVFFSEQSVPKIWITVSSLLDKMDRAFAKNIVGIGITGQQHGIVLWNSETCRKHSLEARLKDSPALSNLVTWQDQRCSKVFLDSLPASHPPQVLATGYGCCSLFWLLRNDPESLKGFDMAGTIQDFFAWMLCDCNKPVMSPQNAEGWGYFNRHESAWNIEILGKAGFPVELLPDLQDKEQFFIGRLRMPWKNIRQDVPVSVGMGDLQCSFVASQENPDDAILNFSTSSQLSFILAGDVEVPTSCETRSYFYDQSLIVAPSLNGGNVIQLFAQTLRSWMSACGVEASDEAIWNTFKEQANDVNWRAMRNDPVMNPRIFGERYDVTSTASANQLRPGSLDIGSIVRGILRGVIQNLAVMIPVDLVKSCSIRRILLTGSLFTTFPQLKEFVEEVFVLRAEQKIGGKDAAFGAAFITAKMLPDKKSAASPNPP